MHPARAAAVLWLPCALALQIPWLATPQVQPLPRRSLTLQSAVHLSTNRTLPPLHRQYSHADLAVTSLSSGHATTQTIKTKREKVWRPSSPLAFQAARRSSFYTPRALAAGRMLTASEMADWLEGSSLEWEEHEIEVPDVTDVETLANLGKMTSNAYMTPEDDGGWYELDGTWNVSDSFGWLEDGIRGHVFADSTNDSVVIAIKGTSAWVTGGGSQTGKNDKTNDNLLFSCCCARVDWTWSTVCDCFAGGYNCKQTCVEDAVMGGSAYYPIATDLFNNVTALYPHANIWLVGHSLGGGLAALLSHTFGVPAVSFESPGDLLPAQRLHLPLPPGLKFTDSSIVTHLYHTADPIAMGVCNGVLSTCATAGFALETRCHTGRSIVYDTVGKLGWSVDIRTHRIVQVVDKLLIDNWANSTSGARRKRVEPEYTTTKWWWPGRRRKDEDGDEGGDEGGGDGDGDDDDDDDIGVPKPTTDPDCVDCIKWSFNDDP